MKLLHHLLNKNLSPSVSLPRYKFWDIRVPRIHSPTRQVCLRRPGPLRPFIFKSPTGLKNTTTTMADAFSDALYFPAEKHPALRLPGTTRLGVPPSLACSDREIS